MDSLKRPMANTSPRGWSTVILPRYYSVIYNYSYSLQFIFSSTLRYCLRSLSLSFLTVCTAVIASIIQLDDERSFQLKTKKRIRTDSGNYGNRLTKQCPEVEKGLERKRERESEWGVRVLSLSLSLSLSLWVVSVIQRRIPTISDRPINVSRSRTALSSSREIRGSSRIK